MYSATARARRRCTATRRDGEPCRAYALWDDPGQRCVIHAGRGKRGPHRSRFAQPSRPAAVSPCRCVAYQWPHRPGGGLCRWPEPPLYRLTTPASSHRWTRWRR
jgi:hypothetical protein